MQYLTNRIYTTQNHTHFTVKYAELIGNSPYTDSGNYLGKWFFNPVLPLLLLLILVLLLLLLLLVLLLQLLLLLLTTTTNYYYYY
jgi:uncharacterized membrane protein